MLGLPGRREDGKALSKCGFRAEGERAQRIHTAVGSQINGVEKWSKCVYVSDVKL